jgi:hypothetical protein
VAFLVSRCQQAKGRGPISLGRLKEEKQEMEYVRDDREEGSEHPDRDYQSKTKIE